MGYRSSLPVLTVNCELNNAYIDLLIGQDRIEKVTFKITLPGLSGGFGWEKTVKLKTKIQNIQNSFQGHVKVYAKTIKYVNGKDVLYLVDITKVNSNIYIIDEYNKYHMELEEPKQKNYHAQLSSGIRTGKSARTSLYVESNNSAEFKFDFLKLLGLEELSENHELLLEWTSKSLSTFEMDFYAPSEELYILTGANDKSVRLFIDLDD